MADKRANLIIALKDEVSAGLGKIRANFLAVAAAVTGVVAVVASFVKSAIESEDATNKLNIALKNQGIFSAELSKEMQRYASELQRTSTFSDETILRTQAMLTTFGLAGIQMKQATQATLDLAAGLGVDLNTAALLVGKSFAGETGTLARYGIIIDENIPRTERFAEVMRQLGQRFGGEAAAATQTFSGRVQVLGNQIDDVKETVGFGLLPVLEKYAGHIQTIVTAMNDWGGIMNTLKITGLEFSRSIIAGIVIAVEQVPLIGQAFKLLGIDLDAVNAKLDEQIAKIQNETIVAQVEGQNQLLNQELVSQGMIDIKKRQAAEAKKIEDKARAENTKRVAADLKEIQRKEVYEQGLREARIAAVQDMLSRIAALHNSSNKAIASAAKAAAIFLITIDTYRAAMAARAALSGIPIIGPALGNAAAAAIIATGFAQIAQITGMKLAAGGMVLPRAGGVPAVVGEGGKAEAVIPLDDERTRDKLAGSGFGGVNITINAGVLVGGEDSVRALARMIDQELFAMRRNNESVAFEAV